MKTILSTAVALMRLSLATVGFVLTGCGGSPAEPSSPVTISPMTATMSVGGSQVFTAGGGGQYAQYLWQWVSPVEGSACLSMTIIINSSNGALNQARVNMLCKPNFSTAQLSVEGNDLKPAISTITLR